ncbi:mucin-binding protein, partial [Streptococcus suis]|uniref:mucin-binding protein n=1 Tax=Streptococcus suis TaxID=1307 RepID=UPI001B080900|nr:hypothetical protein [Streptococcus suis]
AYEAANEEAKTYDNDTATTQEFKVVVTPKITPITPENPGKPGEPIDPNNPDGPKWPEGTDKDSLEKVITRTVSYVKLDNGKESEAAPTRTNTVEYTRTGTINNVTKEVTFEDWTATNDDKTLEGSKLPFVKGYIVKKAEAKINGTTLAVSPESTTEDIPTEHDSKDVEEKVIYVPLGSWIPKIPNEANPPKQQYPNDPNENPSVPGTPTDPGVPPIPYVPGYTPKDPNGNPLTPVDP